MNRARRIHRVSSPFPSNACSPASSHRTSKSSPLKLPSCDIQYTQNAMAVDERISSAFPPTEHKTVNRGTLREDGTTAQASRPRRRKPPASVPTHTITSKTQEHASRRLPPSPDGSTRTTRKYLHRLSPTSLRPLPPIPLLLPNNNTPSTRQCTPHDDDTRFQQQKPSPTAPPQRRASATRRRACAAAKRQRAIFLVRLGAGRSRFEADRGVFIRKRRGEERGIAATGRGRGERGCGAASSDEDTGGGRREESVCCGWIRLLARQRSGQGNCTSGWKRRSLSVFQRGDCSARHLRPVCLSVCLQNAVSQPRKGTRI